MKLMLNGSHTAHILTLFLIIPVLSACTGGTSAIQDTAPDDTVHFPAEYLVADHSIVNRLKLAEIPESAIRDAKIRLKIAYGHTSHGSQITDGMHGLIAFANGRGLGGTYPDNLFAFSSNGSGGSLYLREDMPGDCGFYPRWENETKEMLSQHPEVNVIVWAWCGQVDDKYVSGTLESEYLSPMARLETEYPDVAFVYMTGHLDHGDHANNAAANETIRRFCRENGKKLYDFADIESYNPDGTHFPYANDSCDYFSGIADGSPDGNWALEWMSSHAENVEWYSCASAHSEALNANMKAYAAWWLWCRLAGWNGNL